MAQGRAEQRASEHHKAEAEQIDTLKKERNAARREAAAAEEDAEAGRASHKLVMGVSAAAGTGAGLAGQHYGMDKTAINKYVKKGAIPAGGIVTGILGLFVKGVPGAMLTGFGFGTALGSGTVSLTKKLAGIA